MEYETVFSSSSSLSTYSPLNRLGRSWNEVDDAILWLGFRSRLGLLLVRRDDEEEGWYNSGMSSLRVLGRVLISVTTSSANRTLFTDPNEQKEPSRSNEDWLLLKLREDIDDELMLVKDWSMEDVSSVHNEMSSSSSSTFFSGKFLVVAFCRFEDGFLVVDDVDLVLDAANVLKSLKMFPSSSSPPLPFRASLAHRS